MRMTQSNEQDGNEEMNTCDKCGETFNSEELVWITADGFRPRREELVPAKLYKKYDALCETCYLKSIKFRKGETNGKKN